MQDLVIEVSNLKSVARHDKQYNIIYFYVGYEITSRNYMYGMKFQPYIIVCGIEWATVPIHAYGAVFP